MLKRNQKIGRYVSMGIVVVALLALGILGAGAALAEEGGSGDCEGSRCRGQGSARLMAMAEELELSDEQLERLEAVRELMRERRQERRDRRGTGYSVVMDALDDGQVDPDGIHASIDERLDAKRATAHAVADEMIGFYESLDEEQRATMAEQMEERRGQRGERARRGARGEGDGDGGPCGCKQRRGQRGGPAADDEE
jgi:Spy/CpxP family protein refolding chaperone